MSFEIECSDLHNRYATVHAAGCRDLIDPEPVPSPELAHVSLWPEVAEYTHVSNYAPCVRKALSAAEWERIRTLSGQPIPED